MSGDPGGIRTPDPRLRRPLLYPTELLDHMLQHDICSTHISPSYLYYISFYPHKKMERVKGIEPSRPAWKAGALPLSYTRIRGRSSRIRTCDPLVPSQVRYQTALCPDIRSYLYSGEPLVSYQVIITTRIKSGRDDRI